jgi:hypothetical protein
MQTKTEKPVTFKAPKWAGSLSLSPEQLVQMASTFGCSYPTFGATGGKLKTPTGAGIFSLPPEQVLQIASTFALNYKGSAATKLRTPPRSGVFSLPSEQLAPVAKKIRTDNPADAGTKATSGGAGFRYRDMYAQAMRTVYLSTKKTGAPTVGKKAGSPFGLNPEELLQMASVYGPLMQIYASAINVPLATVPVTVKPTAKEKPSETVDFTKEELHKMVWDGLNFTVVAAATSASIVAIQSPLKSVVVNLSRSGTFVPPYTGGVLGLVKALYAGTAASISGSAARTIWVTGAKKFKPVEGGVVREEGMAIEEGMLAEREEGMSREEGTALARVPGSKGLYVASAAFGDILVTQIPESLSMLKKVPGLLPKDFKWSTPYNASRLMAGGFVPRYATGMINFASLCLLEESIAGALPIENDKAKHTVAGAASGATAAVFGYPLAALKDYALVRAQVIDGKLINKSTIVVIKEMAHMLRTNPEQALSSFGSNALKQMPMRVAMTSAIFAIVAGVGETLGSEPLKPVVSKRLQPPATASSGGFFSTSEKALDKAASPTKEKAPEEGPTSGPI